MRTTITLDEDVAAAVDRVRRERSIGPSAAVNGLVRAGLVVRPEARPFRQLTARLGLTIDVSNVGEAREQLDDLDRR